MLQYGRFVFLSDIFDSWAQWLIIISITAMHTLLTFLLKVPGCPTGYLGPGGYHHYGDFVNCTGGAAGYIDRLVLGNHMYNKTENPIFGHTLRHDPEGNLFIENMNVINFEGFQTNFEVFRVFRDVNSDSFTFN